MVSLNIVSLPLHLEELRIWSDEKDLDIIALNETRLDKSISNSFIKLNNYGVVRRDRNRNGGGVCIFVHDKNNYILRSELVRSDEIEAICIEIIKPNSKPFAVIAAYRPPNQDPDFFFQNISSIIEELDSEEKEIYLVGDLNCNLLATANCKATVLLQTLAETYQLTQLVSEATRVTESSKTLIDLIYANCPNRVAATGVLHLGLSDHSLIFAIRKISIPSKTTHTVINMRSLKKFDPQLFRCDLQNIPWSDLNCINDPNQRWELWKTMFLSVVDKHAPFKRKRVKNKKSPWLTADLKALLIKRDRLKRIAVKSGDPVDWQNFKKDKNFCNNEIRRTKTLFYHKQIQENSGNSKEIWKVINQVASRNTKSDRNISCLKVGTQVITDPVDICDQLNKHFTEIGPKLASSLPLGRNSYTDYVKPTTSSFSLKPIEPTTVYKLMSSMSGKKATGLDGIPCKLIKEAASVIPISISLCDIFNLSIQTCIVPSDWKLAKVIPIHKGDVKDNSNNYRPISVLPSVAKIFEKIVYDQLFQYVTKNDLLSKCQSGFRPLHSTTTALIDATTEWLNNMDQGRLNSVVYLDLAKAFDTVDHDILIHKLSIYGICEMSLNWFRSFLSNRNQRCFVNGHLSEPETLKCGVPQGSILGPLLFLIYINDLPNCLKHSNPRMYADDTNLTTTGSSVVEISHSVNADLLNVGDWLIANKLSLNVVKTEQMFIGSDHNLKRIRDTPLIFLNDEPIKRVDTAKSLGIQIDEKLSWSEQIDAMSKKISRAIGGLRQARPFVPTETLLTMYNSLIQPLFDYCDIVWDGMSSTNADRLQRLQNRAARVITRQNYEIRSTDIRNHLGWRTLVERRKAHKATMMFKIMQGNAPTYLTDLLKLSNINNLYNLRNRDNCLVLPKPKTDFLKKSFQYTGTKLWNDLPNEVRLSDTLTSFKSSLQSLLS